MAEIPKRTGHAGADNSGYMVVTVTELDRLVYEVLKREGAAKPHRDDSGSYIVTDSEKARSQNIMPKVMARYGRKGWRLTAINKMECYVFCKTENAAPVEYMVQTPSDLDKLSLKLLETEGQLIVEQDEDEDPVVHVKDAEQAKIQRVLPMVLDQFKQDNWELAAVSGPQLYFFIRPVKV